jgi:hypothetical protein
LDQRFTSTNLLNESRSFDLSQGSNFFLFVDRKTLTASNPLNVEWATGKGRRVRLTD